MKSEEIKELFVRFEMVAAELDGIECWSARELQDLLGYSKWENFEKVIQKAKDACKNAGGEVAYHFPDVRKTIPMPKGAEKEIDDILLTRYASYLIAQNGDSRKQEIAFAQNYFAVQTRRAELVEQRLLEYERVKAREKLSQTEKQLSGILYERGIDCQGFAIIRSKGDRALFRLDTQMLKRKMGVPDSRPVADFLPTISIKAKDLAADVPKLRFPEFIKNQGNHKNQGSDNGEWVEKTLGEVATFVNEKTSLENLSTNSYISTENILSDYAGVTSASKLPTSGNFTKYRKGDILISNIRPYLKKVWFSDKEGASSNDVFVVRAKSDIQDLFLSFLLKNDDFINYVMVGAKGVKMPRGDKNLISKYPISFPSKPEQQKIASCLSSLDALITAQAEKIEQLKLHKKGLMQSLFPQSRLDRD
jgi:DNA-damage-inducible protein D